MKPRLRHQNGKVSISFFLNSRTKDVDGKSIELFESSEPVKLIAKFKGYDVNKHTDVAIRTIGRVNREQKKVEYKTFEEGA